MILSLDEVLKIKNELMEKYSISLHIHDTCGGQCFSIETKDLKHIEELKEYFKTKKYNLSFSNDNLRFKIKD